MVDGAPAVLAADGSHAIPSVVALTRSGGWLVGDAAKRQAITNVESTIFSIARLMGCRFAEVAEDVRTAPFVVLAAPSGDARVRVGGRDYAPSELMAVVLRRVKALAEASLGDTVTRAVIAVPTLFNDAQRRAVKEAGAIAGLDVVRLANATTAVALAYGLDHPADARIAVLDFGGGHLGLSTFRTLQPMGKDPGTFSCGCGAAPSRISPATCSGRSTA
jgi:molecular chaperone DnaK